MLIKHNSVLFFKVKTQKIHRSHIYKAEIREFTDIFTANALFLYSQFLDLLKDERFEILKDFALCIWAS